MSDDTVVRMQVTGDEVIWFMEQGEVTEYGLGNDYAYLTQRQAEMLRLHRNPPKRNVEAERVGTPTGSLCDFCSGEIVYNGNYFCVHFDDDPAHHYAATEDEDISDMSAAVAAYRAAYDHLRLT